MAFYLCLQKIPFCNSKKRGKLEQSTWDLLILIKIYLWMNLCHHAWKFNCFLFSVFFQTVIPVYPIMKRSTLITTWFSSFLWTCMILSKMPVIPVCSSEKTTTNEWEAQEMSSVEAERYWVKYCKKETRAPWFRTDDTLIELAYQMIKYFSLILFIYPLIMIS